MPTPPTPSGLELGLLDVAIACFALASLAYFALVTLRPSSEGVKSGLGIAGTIFAFLAALALTGWLVHRWISTGHAPYANMYEYAIAFAWGVAVIYLLLERIYGVRALGTLAMPVGLLLSLYCLLLPAAQKVGVKNLMPALKSPWLAVHVGTAVLAYGAFAVGFAAGLAYLLRNTRRLLLLATCALGALPSAGLVWTLVLCLRGQCGWGVPLALAIVWAALAGIFSLGILHGRRHFRVAIPALLAGLVLTCAVYAFVWAAWKWALAPDHRLIGVGHLAQLRMLLAIVNPYTVMLCAAVYLLGAGLQSEPIALSTPDFLDRAGYRAISFGFPLLTLMIFTGAIWADVAWGRYWGWDPKETWSLVTWLVYLGYLHARLVMGWRGMRAAWLATLGFLAVIFTLFGVNYLGGLHAYSE